jgi:hypothetical protein
MVRGLFNLPGFQGLLLPRLGLSGTLCAHFEIPSPIIRGAQWGPGDVDTLLYREEDLEHAVAIEWERVKVEPVTFSTEMPGKLARLSHGVIQANLLREAGYWRAYLGIIVQVDGRERAPFNFLFRGLTCELVKLIRGFPDRERLAPGVGLIFAEVEQPVNKEIWLAGGIGVHVEIEPLPQAQPRELTTWIMQLHRSAGAES